MSNTNRPTDYAACDCGDLCTSCGCSECGRKTDPDTRGPLTLVSGRVVQACAECRAAEAAERGGLPPTCGRCGGRTDGVRPAPSMGGLRIAACDCPSDGVPVAVEDDGSCAQTVRLESDPTIAQTGVEWADKLDAAVAL